MTVTDFNMKFLYTESGRLDQLPVSNGQLIFCQDTHEIYFDFEDLRKQYGGIVILATDDLRSTITPVNKTFYYVEATNYLWFYNEGWFSVSSSRDEFDASILEGYATTDMLSSIPRTEISDTEPVEDNVNLWIKPESEDEFKVPEINDDIISTVDTWSSNKINNEISTLSQEKVDKTGITLGYHTDGLLYVFVDGEPVGTGVEFIGNVVSSDVVGYVDSENNIVLTGALPEGTYTVKYETEDGTFINVGTLSNILEVMVNQISISTDANGNLFVGSNGEIGYKSGNRLSSSGGGEPASSAHFVTGFMPVKDGDIVRIKNVYMGDINGSDYCYALFFDENKAYTNKTFTTLSFLFSTDEGNGVYRGLIAGTTLNNLELAKFMRICSKSITADSIITINQEIV